jgi:uncharacterized membrane protein YbaN (DUF454 family)
MPRWKRLSIAAGFFVLGVIGVITPVMPQTLFFLIAVLLVGPDIPPARRAVMGILRRWPKLRKLVPRWLRDEGKRLR